MATTENFPQCKELNFGLKVAVQSLVNKKLPVILASLRVDTNLVVLMLPGLLIILIILLSFHVDRNQTLKMLQV